MIGLLKQVTDEFAESKESEESAVKVEYPKPVALEAPPAAREAKSESNDDVAAPKTVAAKGKASGKKPSWLKLR